jgi:hypothetical protein
VHPANAHLQACLLKPRTCKYEYCILYLVLLIRHLFCVLSTGSCAKIELSSPSISISRDLFLGFGPVCTCALGLSCVALEQSNQSNTTTTTTTLSLTIGLTTTVEREHFCAHLCASHKQATAVDLFWTDCAVLASRCAQIAAARACTPRYK